MFKLVKRWTSFSESSKSDVDKALKGISVIQRKQIPFAAVLSLTKTAKKVMMVEKLMMEK